jgi:hypothetical protein
VSLQQEFVAPCRRMALASAAKVHPAIVSILADSYARSDANTARLAGRDITWGEYPGHRDPPARRAPGRR